MSAPPQGASARTRTVLLASGVVMAVVIALVSLVLSSIAIVRVSAVIRPPVVQDTGEQQTFIDDADEALCEAIGPLLSESRTMKNAFADVGPQGSAQQRAAIPKFVADTREWAQQAQAVLNDHSDPPRHLTRTIQRYIDDMLLFVDNIAPDRDPDPADSEAWDLSIVDLRGPRGRCRDVGVDWWG